MSSQQPRKKKVRKPRKKQVRNSRLSERVCVSVTEWCFSTGTSKPTAYRMMSDGRLRFVQLGERIRKIPTTEYQRLGRYRPRLLNSREVRSRNATGPATDDAVNGPCAVSLAGELGNREAILERTARKAVLAPLTPITGER